MLQYETVVLNTNQAAGAVIQRQYLSEQEEVEKRPENNQRQESERKAQEDRRSIIFLPQVYAVQRARTVRHQKWDIGDIDEASLLYRLAKQRGEQRNRSPDSTRLFCISITMYEESFEQLTETMQGILMNLILMRDKLRLIIEGQVIIFLIADGISKTNVSFLQKMESANLFDRTAIPSAYKDGESYTREVPVPEALRNTAGHNVGHLFQAWTNYHFGLSNDYDVPRYNFMFMVKHCNRGKLDSHYWLFNGFYKMLEPDHIVLLDIGTAPLNDSLMLIYQYLVNNAQCGGICGEIEVDIDIKQPNSQECCYACCNNVLSQMLVLSQYVEYKMSHFLDKAYESIFGFLSVLPGAFCAFRWEAIKGDPLDEYFKGRDKSDLSPFDGNMYLAEDRIMVLSIIAQKSYGFYLHYMPNAKAKTDPPSSISMLMKQRRRWINGSTFATIYVLLNCVRIYTSGQSCARKAALTLLFLHQILQTVISLLVVGITYATFSIFTRSFIPNESVTSISNFLENCYLALLAITLLWAIGKNVEDSHWMFWFVSILLGLLYIFMLVAAVLFILDMNSNDNFNWKRSTSVILFLIYIGLNVLVVSFNFRSYSDHPFYFMLGMFFNCLLTPMYLQVFVIYAYCNIHDVTWGTRATDERVRQEQIGSYRAFRVYVLTGWLICNFGFGYLITRVSRLTSEDVQDVFMLSLSLYLLSILLVKLLFSCCYIFAGHKLTLKPFPLSLSIDYPTLPDKDELKPILKQVSYYAYSEIQHSLPD